MLGKNYINCAECFWSLQEIRPLHKTYFCQFLQTSLNNTKILAGECSHHNKDEQKVLLNKNLSNETDSDFKTKSVSY